MATERVTPADAWRAVDVPTLALLFGLMVMSAQFRLGGFYGWTTRRIVEADVGPAALLAAVVAVTAVLSNLVSNVPAVMMLLPKAMHPLAGPVLALASTRGSGSR